MNAAWRPGDPVERDAVARLLAAIALLAGFALVGRGPAPPTSAAARVCDTADGAETATLVNCLALQPRSVELLVALGARFEDAERWRDAEAMYRRAVAVDARDADVQLRLSRVLLRRGDREGARIALARVQALRPGSVPDPAGAASDPAHAAIQ